MSNAVLITPSFWDPVCPPLGIVSLKSFAEQFGHKVNILDLNTTNKIFEVQEQYFKEVINQFPYMKQWNIKRNGTEMLSLHQILYLFAKNQKNYKELVTDVLNMDKRPFDKFVDSLNISKFDDLFDKLYSNIKKSIENIVDEKIDVVGCHLNNSTWAATLFILKFIKDKYPHIKTVVGGPGPIFGFSSNIKEVEMFMKKNTFIDHFIVGEGEKCFLEILNNKKYPENILSKSSLINSPSNIPDKILIKDLPVPDYEGLDVKRYLMLSIAASRGCPFECSFCAETVYWDGFRSDKGQRVFEMMDYLVKKYQRNSFYLCDSLANHIISPLTKLISENNKEFLVDCYLRADKICTNEERTKEWRNGGLFKARIGCESANQRILDDMVKMTTPENMAKSFSALAKHGILTTTLWIVGYSGETEDEFENTLRFIEDNRKNIFQADAYLFQYNASGLSGSSKFEERHGSANRFTEEVNQLLAFSPYVLEDGIKPAEKFDRLVRYTTKMKELDIPNPYSFPEMLYAINRFKDLHTNSGWNPLKSMMPYTDVNKQAGTEFFPLTAGH